VTAVLAAAVGATVRFGPLVANDAIDLQVAAGEVVGLLGANGSGKSTCMRLLLGLLRPDAGRIELFGAPPSRATRRRVGYVPQGLGLYEDLTVAENLSFSARAYGSARPSLDDDPRLRAESNTLVRELPLGLRRRLAFAAALAHDPRLLVLDEPTSGVDPLARSRLWDTIRAAAERGAGVLVSTHYMEEVEHCDRIVVLDAGRVIAAGTVADIVGGRHALQITTAQWDAAFRALDAAGLPPSLHGRTLHLLGADPHRVAAVLRAAGIDAELATVRASFEEAFTDLLTASAGR
jgi:ABC-2 type transport system ATP-binding protein/ribosome-dependent ATPase